MSKKKTVPPRGAEVLYSRLLRCEPSDGLVLIEVASGAFTQVGFIPLKVAIQLQQGLRGAVERLLSDENVETLPVTARADH